MKISKTISLDFEDLSKINDKIEKGEFENVTEFVQHAIKKELNSDLNVRTPQ